MSKKYPRFRWNTLQNKKGNKNNKNNKTKQKEKQGKTPPQKKIPQNELFRYQSKFSVFPHFLATLAQKERTPKTLK